MTTLACTLDRKGFKDALGHAARVTERRNTIPILSYVRLDIGRDIVRLSATDLDLYLTDELPAATEGEGVILLALDALKSAVSKFTGDSVRLQDIGGKAIMTCTKTGARLILPTMPASDWPELKAGDMLAEFRAPADAFTGAIATLLPFASTEETRYYLMGTFIHATCDQPPRTAEHEELIAERDALRDIFQDALAEAGDAEGRTPEAEAKLQEIRERTEPARAEIDARIAELEAERCKPNVLRFATTDGHRLGRFTMPLPEGATAMPDAILPRKACKVLGAIVGKKPSRTDIGVAVNGAKMQLRYGRFTLLAKLIDGTFPDYTRVIPTHNDIALTVPAADFAVAVDSVAAIAIEKTRAVAISISSTEGVILSCSSPANGRAALVFEGATVSEGAQLPIGFNAAYLKQILAAFDGDVTLQLADAAAPTAFTSPDNPGLLIVLMPMRVDGIVMTRADVDASTLDPWLAFVRNTKDMPAALHAIMAMPNAHGRKLAYAAIGKVMREAIDYLTDQGTPRHIARLKAKAELAFAVAGDLASNEELMLAANRTGDRMLRLVARYGSLQIGGEGFKALSFRAGSDPGPQDPAALDPAEAAEIEAAPVAAADNPVIEHEGFTCAGCGRDEADCSADPCDDVREDRGEEPETVAAEAPVADKPKPQRPLIDPVDVVKVLTVTDQAVFVARADWMDESVSSLTRYHADGYAMYGNGGQRTILRANLKRVVPPRNRGDRPMPAAPKSPPAESDVAERLARLESLVAGLAPSAAIDRPKRSAARLRAVRAYLRLRAERATLQRQLASANAMLLDACEARRVAEAKAGKLDAAIECRDIALADVAALRVRCDALERLHAASASLDTAAAALNGKPAIILPVSRTSARAQ
jgi:DNA polymerase III sliding clamp (beta) subunit (PCNA family)